MQLNPQKLWPCLVIGATLLAGSVDAMANTTTFAVHNIGFHLTGVGGSPALGVLDYLGEAQFTWTYTAGDFANGLGILSFVNNPFNGSPEGNPTTDAADLTGFSTTLAGGVNVQNLSYDIAVNFAAGLIGPGSSTVVNGGTFDLTGFYPGPRFFSAQQFTGSIAGGSVVPAGLVANVPEPETYALLLAGLGLLGLKARRCKQQAT